MITCNRCGKPLPTHLCIGDDAELVEAANQPGITREQLFGMTLGPNPLRVEELETENLSLRTEFQRQREVIARSVEIMAEQAAEIKKLKT